MRTKPGAQRAWGGARENVPEETHGKGFWVKAGQVFDLRT